MTKLIHVKKHLRKGKVVKAHGRVKALNKAKKRTFEALAGAGGQNLPNHKWAVDRMKKDSTPKETTGKRKNFKDNMSAEYDIRTTRVVRKSPRGGNLTRADITKKSKTGRVSLKKDPLSKDAVHRLSKGKLGKRMKPKY